MIQNKYLKKAKLMYDKWKPPHKPPHKDDDCELVPCFTAGSYVVTNSGLKAVETVSAGDLILTRDNGFKEVLWAGSAKGRNGVLYNGTIFSFQHRIIQRINNEETLVSAKHLAKAGLAIEVIKPLTFVHFMFEQHEIVNVDSIWSESFYPGDWIMKNTPQGKEIKELFGDISMNFARPLSIFKQNIWRTSS